MKDLLAKTEEKLSSMDDVLANAETYEPYPGYGSDEDSDWNSYT